jgi:hypothetical protein
VGRPAGADFAFARLNARLTGGEYPKAYARDDLPKIDHYPGGQTLPTPKSIDFTSLLTKSPLFDCV